MQLKTLKVFCDVVSRRSFSRAAEDNDISQSGASQMVHHLEEELGVRLIDRSKRPFLLTPEGEVYFEGCKKLIHRYFSLEEEVRALHLEVAGRVNVASIYSVGLSHIDRLVHQFASQHPKAKVRLEYHHPDKVYELVANGQVDFGLVSYPKTTRTIKAQSWRAEPIVLVCSPAHPYAGEQSLPLAALDGQKLVAFEGGLKIRRELDKALAAAEAEPAVSMEFDNIENIKRAVEIDAGLSLLPEPTVAREVADGSLVAIEIKDAALNRPLGIIQRKGIELGKTARRFAELLLNECEDVATASQRGPSHNGNGRSHNGKRKQQSA